MSRLFAALDVAGAVRFVGEVPRGTACGCVCPECSSPLIAKQGDEREWHFAHEPGQERPECEAGALNLFRRLVIEHLRALPDIELPRYETRVAEASSTAHHVEHVAWDARFVQPLHWLPPGPKHGAVATGRLDNGAIAQLFVDIAYDRASHHLTGHPEIAEIVFWCPAPPLGALRERSAAGRHIGEHGHFVWTHHPDTLGLVEAARRRIHDRVVADERTAATLRERRAEEEEGARRRTAEEASRRWSQIAKRMRDGHSADTTGSPQVAASQTAEAPHVHEQEPAVARTSEPQWPWAPQRKPNTAFIFYRWITGEAWVFYTMSDGNTVVAPWPQAQEGWDEALPASVGLPDGELKVYRVKDLPSAMTFFGSRAVTVRASSDPREFDRL